MEARRARDPGTPHRPFAERHIGPSDADVARMLETVGCPDLDAFVEAVVPEDIRMRGRLDLPAPRSEREALADLRRIARRNVPSRAYIGLGYHGTVLPPVIARNVLENPGWYTAYTPYQAEISQGRLEALLNFQTMVADLVGLPLCNASLLDEATAAAEAMTLCHRALRGKRNRFLVAADVHPQTWAVVEGRARALGIEVARFDPDAEIPVDDGVCGVLVQQPGTEGVVRDLAPIVEAVHARGALVAAATDLLACALLVPPGEQGADVVVGSAQRFGVPMGYGGPHPAFLAAKDAYLRQLPGRIIGVSKDASGRLAYRMALQTREQHIRRERATSNICTAQVLLAVIAGFYGVYHGPDGIRRIARYVHDRAHDFAAELVAAGHRVSDRAFFDTVVVEPTGRDAKTVLAAAFDRGIDLRDFGDGRVGIAFDETVTEADVADLRASFGLGDGAAAGGATIGRWPEHLDRSSAFMTHPVFSAHRSEHEMLRYLHRLEAKDLSLTTSMIPLGSCTMKLNATSEMLPISWPEFADLHPFAPPARAEGYAALAAELEKWLAEITGFAAVSLQPNAGAQGEYAGLLVIRAYHESRGDDGRRICLIPTSAHGTNPASAVLAGLTVRPVRCDDAGNIDLEDLEAKAAEAGDALAALMVTYPSTHGVFEASIRRICDIVHRHGGQVYLDGANMNAQVGLARPGDYGADVCHLNLHKTFCIPHGGGGPGMGPIAVAAHLAPFLPGHPLVPTGGERPIAPVAAAPMGSASILPISWMYIAMMGAEGLARASKVAVLAANYMARRLEGAYRVLYKGQGGFVAHEFILDLRPFKKAGIEAEDVAKRLADYGFHAPTMSFPVPGTLMIEPTESESLAELDRFCDALLRIREEIRNVEEGRWPRDANPLKGAPHTAADVCGDAWDRPYGRTEAAFPAPWLYEHKYWPPVGRVDNVYGDRNPYCACPPMSAYAEDGA
ncbi:MAG: glycine dehydrogenase (aminomethyl-transferring) [Deltaproteobacteria bacterium]|nr:MAG: glycine dehydrogenase (aminomethyl-transferring) [Deltaproteobacteria bacterium]